MERLPRAIRRTLESKVIFTVIRFKEGGREQTHFKKIRDGEGREAIQGAYHVLDDAKRFPAALAVSKAFIPADPWAMGRALPLTDEAGAVEALDEDFQSLRVVIHGGTVAGGLEG